MILDCHRMLWPSFIKVLMFLELFLLLLSFAILRENCILLPPQNLSIICYCPYVRSLCCLSESQAQISSDNYLFSFVLLNSSSFPFKLLLGHLEIFEIFYPCPPFKLEMIHHHSTLGFSHVQTLWYGKPFVRLPEKFIPTDEPVTHFDAILDEDAPWSCEFAE